MQKTTKAIEKVVLGNFVPGVFKVARQSRKAALLAEGRAELAQHLAKSPLKNKPVTNVDHHQSHAYSAYYGLARDDAPALVFTADGRGDQASAAVWVAKNRKLERVATTAQAHHRAAFTPTRRASWA